MNADDDCDMSHNPPMNMFGRPRFSGDFRHKRYVEAYGCYSGGYGPPRPLMSLPLHGFAPRPPFPEGRGMGLRGPPNRISHEEQAIHYLLRCGVPEENVVNLPPELLNLIEPRHCGLCGYDLDSPKLSRLHYASKNHFKAQTKWLSQTNGAVVDEAPIKSRELYCELCDVHITSKVHANSHYEGKIHISIVQGRKIPKNPKLLQNGAEARLEKLIRREKKFLKKPLERTKAIFKKPVNTPSESYCDICKISVSCPEQMTYHMNGKRHLAKEKQHILKVLSGEIPNPADQEVSDTTAVVAGASKPVNKQPADAEMQDLTDWGYGSSKWDDV